MISLAVDEKEKLVSQSSLGFVALPLPPPPPPLPQGSLELDEPSPPILPTK